MRPQVLPVWLEQTPTKLPEPKKRLLSRDYLEKTLNEISSLIAEDSHSIAVLSNRQILHHLDPTVKLVGIVALLVTATATKSISFLLFLNSIVFIAALYAGIGGKVYLARIFIPVFLFTGMSVLPGILNWITPGQPLFVLYSGLHWQTGWFNLPVELTVTKQGLKGAFFVILRGAASLGLVTLHVRTTRWSLFTKSLAKLGLPAVAVTVFDLTYRYLYLFLFLFMDYLLGRKSRLAGRESQSAKLSWIGGTIAGFLRLTGEYSCELNQALASRGYRGEYPADLPLTFRIPEAGFTGLIILICFSAWGGFF
ncbi:abc/ecf transporter transmembrane component [Lucifera butyrica]|uniref:Abc/ecf transporter transmembrane component n=1 Tax=Lucifera butyrica TaxID=1351585 RepID=A0A498R9P4_9FIRM|nr:CbiQ family ECF transporter T component [Lucifera butyrica]VBB07677.1 abc/ecf transporter transmembrane component [Lucifera butyrica]